MVRRIVALCLAGIVLASCEAKETFVLMPDGDGSGAIEVRGAGTEALVDTAWSGVAVDDAGVPYRPALGMSRGAVVNRFSAVLDRQPRPPQTEILHFETGAVTLTAPARARMSDVVLMILDRSHPDVSVVGHTDRAGDPALNLELSRRRAEAVRDLLVAKGVDPEIITVASHGERNPLVPTEDDVAEPRNRRVEVIVR